MDREKINFEDEKYNDDWPDGSLEQFIWERCEADNTRVREIMRFIEEAYGQREN